MNNSLTQPDGEIRPVPDVTERLVQNLEERFELTKPDGFIMPVENLNVANWRAGIAFVVNLLRASFEANADTADEPLAEQVLDQTYFALTRRIP